MLIGHKMLLKYNLILKTKEDWDNMTKPPEGWIKHKGWKQKINKP